jgi:DNA repair protein RadD
MENVIEPPVGGKAPHSLGLDARAFSSTIVLRDYQERGMAAIRTGYGRPISKAAIEQRAMRIAQLERAAKKKPHSEAIQTELTYARAREIQRIVKAMALVAPTGSGKGSIAAYVCIGAASKGNPSIFIVHSREIVKDVHQRIVRCGAPAGLILAGEPEHPELPIQVCSIQTLIARKKRPPAKFIIWDECHHCVAKTYRVVADAYPHAKHLGLTASPIRGDNSPLGDVFDEMVELASVRELTQRGFLVPCIIISPDNHTGHNLSAHPVTVYQEKTPGRRAIVFAASKFESRALAQEFNAAGVPAVAIDESTPKMVRERNLAMYREGQIRVLVNVNVLTEGFDSPETEVIILAKPYGSPGAMIQATGRGLRPYPGKTHCTLIDLVGNWHIHGRPSDERDLGLYGKGIVLMSQDATVCPSCKNGIDAYRIATGGPGCPLCGYMPGESIQAEAVRANIVETSLHEYHDQQLQLPLRVGAFKADVWDGERWKEDDGP